MQTCSRLLICFFATCTISHVAFSNTHQSPAERKYTPGEHYRYRMTTHVTHNGKWQNTIVAVCELQVKQDSAGIPYDEVRWISKKVISAKDTVDKSSEAVQVKPYRISLHPKGTLNIPTIDVPDMTGEITDFNTFFVAISPKLGIAQLKKKGDQHKQQEVVKGNFSNGKDIIVGNDCLAVTLSLTDNTKDKLLLQTSFMPPADSCLQYLLPDLRQPVAGDTINNFQMVRPFANNRFIVSYGRENFVINSTVRKKDGKLLQAGMINDLLLNMKLNCNAQYADCQGTMPYKIYRALSLELLND